MQDTINELKEQMQGISLVAYEASAERHTREKKHIITCFTIVIALLIIALIGSNLAWIIHKNSMGKVTETVTTETITETYENVEQTTDNGGNNVIGGDING